MNKKAFTLIEIVIVSVIVGILALMAIPNFVKTINNSYKQDALHNLMAIYAAQQNYMQNNGGYNGISSDGLAEINQNLGLSITAIGGMTYSCDGDTLKSCSVTAPASSGDFTVVIALDKPISSTTTLANCDENYQATDGNNPCYYSNYQG